MLDLRLLGGPGITRGDGAVLTGGAVQRHRLALLALLALAPDSAMTRDKLLAYLWPERDDEHGRNLLKQAVHVLRRELGEAAILTVADEIRLNRGIVRVDVGELVAAFERGDHQTAVALYRGPFLDGFFLRQAPEFEQWAERERVRLADIYGKALEQRAEAAETQHDFLRAVERWKARAAHDPYDSRVALRLAQALAAAGNRAGALQHLALQTKLLQREFSMPPPAQLTELVERLRREEAEPGEHAAGVEAPRAPVRPGDLGERAAAGAGLSPGATQNKREGQQAIARPRIQRRLVSLGLAGTFLIAAAVALFDREPEATGAPTTGSSAETQLRRRMTNNVAAHELYRRGSEPGLMRTDSGARRLIEYFQQAIALDSTYAAAYAGLAGGYLRITMGDKGDLSAAKLLALAETAAVKAVALDDSLADAHATLAIVRMLGRDYRAAESEFRQAIELDPENARIREKLAGLYLVTERPAEGLAEAARALKLDSLAASSIAELSRALLFNNRCDEALTLLEKIAAVRPPLLRVGAIAAQCHALHNRWSSAIAVLRPQAEHDVTSLSLLGYLLGRAGQRDEALRIHAQLIDRWRGGQTGAAHVAVVYAGLGELGEAFAWLHRAIDDGSLTLQPAFGIVMEPMFHELQRDSRFSPIKQRLGLP
jgi:DNA-binding SARP family transcriptional activator